MAGSPRIDASGHDVTRFASPTGAIVCVLAPGTVRCDVSDVRYALPPRPASCRQDWGQGVEMASGRAALTCNGDTVREDAFVGAAGTWWHGERGAEVIHPRPGTSAVALSYGATIVAGTLACTSERGGVTCLDVSGGHFTVSRDTYQISAQGALQSN